MNPSPDPQTPLHGTTAPTVPAPPVADDIAGALHLPAFRIADDWVTRFRLDEQTVGGRIDLTRDARFHEWRGTGVALAGARVLELGALEGAHTFMLCEAGAREVVSVEGRPENFIKCCIVKNALALDPATFVLDDIQNVTLERYGRFDVALASGVLYHQANPMRVLTQLARLAPVVLVWTHIATPEYPDTKPVTVTFADRTYTGKWYREPDTNLAGLEAKSFWPFLPDLRRMFADAGFGGIDEVAVDWQHPQGADWLGTLWLNPAMKHAA